MGLGTLITRAASQTILASWFNDIKSALCLDVVPRDANGIPSDSAGSLGTEDYPWNNVRCTSLFVGGNPIDPTLVTSPTYQIKSGKENADGYPSFLTPAGTGNGLSCVLSATATPLELIVNNISVTVSADTTFSGLNAAASSNNTCTINDTTIPSSADSSKLRGEYDENIFPIASVGSNITAANGEVQPFLCGSEVILCQVDTTNSRLIPIFRGWAGTERGVINHGDTLTILSVSTLLLKNDGATKLGSAYFPESVSTVPAAGTSGKVYYERSSNRWAYDTGSEISYDYIALGFAVSNSADCLYSQPLDFEKSWQVTENVRFDTTAGGTTVTVRRNSIVNVQGSDIRFTNDIAITQASNMDAGETIAQDKTFYIYVKADGSLVFSSVAPRKYSAFLKGSYHPHKYYRCIGAVATNAAATTFRNGLAYNDDCIRSGDLTNIIWSGTAPTSKTLGKYYWYRDRNTRMVHVKFVLHYSTYSVAQSSHVYFDFPADLPMPYNPAGIDYIPIASGSGAILSNDDTYPVFGDNFGSCHLFKGGSLYYGLINHPSTTKPYGATGQISYRADHPRY